MPFHGSLQPCLSHACLATLAGISSDNDSDEDDSDDDDDEPKKSADRRKEQYISVKTSKLKMLERLDHNGERDDGDDDKEREREARRREMEKLKKDIQRMSKGSRAVKLGGETQGAKSCAFMVLCWLWIFFTPTEHKLCHAQADFANMFLAASFLVCIFLRVPCIFIVYVRARAGFCNMCVMQLEGFVPCV